MLEKCNKTFNHRYNTWPLMNGKILPVTAFDKDPKWKNFFENRALVQFNHRNMAYIT